MQQQPTCSKNPAPPNARQLLTCKWAAAQPGDARTPPRYRLAAELRRRRGVVALPGHNNVREAPGSRVGSGEPNPAGVGMLFCFFKSAGDGVSRPVVRLGTQHKGIRE
jgi:hypothetical protein